MIIQTTNTAGLLILAKNSEGRNRSVYLAKLRKSLDPNGLHLLSTSFIHNDQEIRTHWLVKIANQDMPEPIWLDVDPEILNAVLSPFDTELLDVAEYN